MIKDADESSPAPERTLPYLRAWNILFRTAHIGAIGALFGGHVFGVAAERLVPWLYASVVTGMALFAIEMLPDWRWCKQLSGLMTIAKVLLLVPVLWFWDYRVAFLAGVIVLGSAGSHMPKKMRHYSIRFGK